MFLLRYSSCDLTQNYILSPKKDKKNKLKQPFYRLIFYFSFSYQLSCAGMRYVNLSVPLNLQVFKGESFAAFSYSRFSFYCVCKYYIFSYASVYVIYCTFKCNVSKILALTAALKFEMNWSRSYVGINVTFSKARAPLHIVNGNPVRTIWKTQWLFLHNIIAIDS